MPRTVSTFLHLVIKRSSTKPDYVKPNFHFYSEEFSKGFEGYSIIHFSSDYKSFMAKLNDRVVSEFSDVAFYFDGSRIMHAQKELMDEMKRT